MKLKVYYSDSVESALRRARQDLGAEAMLLETKPSPPHQRHLGQHQVVFAAPDEAAATPSNPPSAPEPQWVELARGIDSIRRLLYQRQAWGLPAGRFLSHPQLAELYQELTANDVDAELAAQLMARLARSAEQGAARSQLETELREDLGAMVAVAPQIGRPDARPAVAEIGRAHV